MLYVNNKYLEPAPLVTINKTINFAADGRPLSPLYNISLQGTILPDRGNPRVSEWYVSGPETPDSPLVNSDDRFNAINTKQERIRKEFSVSGLMIRYEPSGYSKVYFYPKLQSINFEPGTWTIFSRYNIELIAHKMYRNEGIPEDDYGADLSGYYLTSVSDGFSINEREDGSSIKDISRTVSATATTAYGSGFITPSGEAWLNAKAWVLNRITTKPFASGDFFLGNGSGSQYNLVQTETVDKYAGTYSIAQRYVYHVRNYTEQRQISKAYEYNVLGDGGPDYLRITVNGTIQGMDATNNPSGKLTNARSYYDMMITGLAPYVGAYGNPISVQKNENHINGSIDYTVNYVNILNSTYKHNYDVSYSWTNAQTPQVTINGQIEGFTPSTFFTDASGTIKFHHAVSGWNTLRPTLRSLAFNYGGVLGGTGMLNYYSNLPLNKSVSFNRPQGTINYSYTYQFVGTGNLSNKYTDEYNIEYTSPNAPSDLTKAGLLVSATINGVINGLVSNADIDDPSEKYDNAKTAWLTTIAPLIYTRVSGDMSNTVGDTSPAIKNKVVSKTIALNKVNGTITYSINYNNFNTTGHTSVAAQEITVEDANPNDIFAVQIIPGRQSGPIIQNINTTSERRRNVSVAITLYPKTGGYWDYSDIGTPEVIASGLIQSILPTGVRKTSWWIAGDSVNWNFKNGFYTRNLSIVY